MQAVWISPGCIILILLTSLALLKYHLTLEEGKGLYPSRIIIPLPAGSHLLGALRASLSALAPSKMFLQTCPSANCSVSRALLRLRTSKIQVAPLLERCFFPSLSSLFGLFVPELLTMTGQHENKYIQLLPLEIFLLYMKQIKILQTQERLS